jgi:hypothetical protein
VGLGGRWVFHEVGRLRGVWSQARSFWQDPAVGFILPARSFLESPKREKKNTVGLADPWPARPNGGSRWPAALHRGLPSSFSSFLFFLFSSFAASLFSLASCAVGSRIFVCIFFSLCEVVACEWWAKKPIFLPHPN